MVGDVKGNSSVIDRVLAFGVDLLIPVIIVEIIISSVPNGSDIIDAYHLEYVGVVVMALYILLKDIVGGRSIGKRLFGLAVRKVEDSKQVPSHFKLIFRNVTLIFFYVEGMILKFHPLSLRLGDMMTKTYVVSLEKAATIPDTTLKMKK